MPFTDSRLQPASAALIAALMLAGLSSSRAVQAQALSSALDVGIASGNAFAGAAPSALLLQPAIRWDHPSTSVSAQASWLASPSAHMDGDASVSGRYYSPAFGNLRLELGAAAARTAGPDVIRASNALQGDVSVSYAFGSGGVWLGAAHRASSIDSLPGQLQMFSAGSWRRLGSTVFTASVTTNSSGGSRDVFGAIDPSNPGSGIGDTLSRNGSVPARHYSDVESSVYWSHGPLALDGLIGTRVSTSYGQRTTWGHAQASWALGGQFALVATGGSRASEPAIGRLGGNFFSFGVRLASAPWIAHALHPGARSTASSFGVRADGPARIIYVRAPAARTIELMADFTDWQPVVMRHASNDEWQVAMQIAPGTHRVNIRVDGGQWSAPPGASTVQDEFNGVVGLVVIP
ncbi:MAG: glycogen-binding domain-containing protein [Gemmatimonas sp.]|nr:glycogen-binding domain-containing protein [Gemmatimonadaceae bacterium]